MARRIGVSPDVIGYLGEHPEFTECRTEGRHAWPRRGQITRLQGGGYERVRLCSDCGGERTDLYDRTGRRIGKSKVRLPHGYRRPGGIDPNDLAALRVESYKRQLNARKEAAANLRERLSAAKRPAA